MEVKHTLGPWTVDDRDLCSLVFSPSYAGRVAMCDQFTGRLGPDETERKANARLIAAAPCLLEALKALVSPWEEMLDVEIYENMKQHEAFRIVDARAAIAKAAQP